MDGEGYPVPGNRLRFAVYAFQSLPKTRLNHILRGSGSGGGLGILDRKPVDVNRRADHGGLAD